jgi:hypothetical protein
MNSTDKVIGDDCVLMLHMDGADASTNFTDSSNSEKEVTAVADAQIDTGQSVFGGASAQFDGALDHLTCVDSADWDILAADFTIDLRFRTTDNTKLQGIVEHYQDGSNFWVVRYTGSGILLYYSHASGGGVILQNTWTWTPTNNTWYHVALIRTGNDFKLFVDGVAQGSTYTDSDTIYPLTGVLYIGVDKHWTVAVGDGQGYVVGHIDEFRIVKGTAVWTNNFTPPTAAYSSGSQSAFFNLF